MGMFIRPPIAKGYPYFFREPGKKRQSGWPLDTRTLGADPARCVGMRLNSLLSGTKPVLSASAFSFEVAV